MTVPKCPWLTAAVFNVGVSDTMFMSVCNNKFSTDPPSDVTLPFATARTVTNANFPNHGGAWRGVVQIDGWAATGISGTDPRMLAWNIAAEAGRAFTHVRSHMFEGHRYSMKTIEGPIEAPADTSRGQDSPLYRAYVRIEVTAKVA